MYVRTEAAVQGTVAQGTGVLLAKVDVKCTYHNMPVHPDDWWLMGMQWEGALLQ